VKLPKLKLGRVQLIILVVVVVAVVAVLFNRSHGAGGSGGGMDSDATRACSDFNSGYPKAKDKTARLALADKVTRSSAQSSNRTIADKAMDMGRSAGETSAKWKSSATALLDACHEAGWSS
jgi:hypothetical protein